MSEETDITFGQKQKGDGFKPCPKCGRYPTVLLEDDEETVSIYCPNNCANCYALFQLHQGVTEKHGIDLWNSIVEQIERGDKVLHSMDTAHYICKVCENLKAMLLEKNRKYGDSAINPIRVFSNASPIEQIKVRMDDKLNRIRNQQNDEDEDVWKDLAGYMILLLVAREIKKEKGEVQA